MKHGSRWRSRCRTWCASHTSTFFRLEGVRCSEFWNPGEEWVKITEVGKGSHHLKKSRFLGKTFSKMVPPPPVLYLRNPYSDFFSQIFKGKFSVLFKGSLLCETMGTFGTFRYLSYLGHIWTIWAIFDHFGPFLNKSRKTDWPPTPVWESFSQNFFIFKWWLP